MHGHPTPIHRVLQTCPKIAVAVNNLFGHGQTVIRPVPLANQTKKFQKSTVKVPVKLGFQRVDVDQRPARNVSNELKAYQWNQ